MCDECLISVSMIEEGKSWNSCSSNKLPLKGIFDLAKGKERGK